MNKSFKNYLSFIINKSYFAIVIVIFCFIMGYFITSYVYNNNFNYYQYRFSTTEIIDYKSIISEEALGQIPKKYAYIDYQKMLQKEHLKIESLDGEYYLSAKSSYFKSVKGAEGYFATLIDGIEKSDIEFSTLHYANPYLNGIYTGLVGLMLSLLAISCVFFKHKDMGYKNIYDNVQVYKYPFHKSYWVKAFSEYKVLKNLVIMTILLALMQVVKIFTLPSGFANLGLSFSFLFFSVICLLYGPITGLMIGFISDILGFILFPGGFSFNMLYTLNAMLAGFTYGLFFYKTKITFAKALFARIIVNIFINAFLGSFWWGIVTSLNFNQTITYLLFTSLPKNLLYLLPQSFLLFITLKALMPIFKSLNVVDCNICNNITLL